MSVVMESFWRRLAHTRMRDVLRGRIDGRLDWRRLVAKADLPDAAAERIEQVIRKARLWRSEQLDVAAELVAHFQDGHDAGASAESLVDAFGDPKLAAKLIRRSKTRCRPLWWQAWWWATRGLTALVGVYLLMFLWMLPGRPTVSVDYVQALNERATSVPPEDRAWPLYREAFLSLGAVREDAIDEVGGQPRPGQVLWNGVLEFWRNADVFDAIEKAGQFDPDASAVNDPTTGEPVGASWKEIKAWLVEHEDFLQQIRTAATKPTLGYQAGFVQDYLPEDRRLFGVQVEQIAAESSQEANLENRLMIGVMLEHADPLRTAAEALVADTLRQAEVGSGEIALANVIAVLRIGKHLGEHPILISGYMQVGCHYQAIQAVRQILAQRADLWSEAQLRDLAHAFAAARLDANYWYAGEKTFFYDFVQRIYTDDGQGDGRIAGHGLALISFISDVNLPRPNQLAARLADPALYFAMPSRAEMLAKFEELWALGEREVNMPLWRRKDQGGGFQQAMIDLQQDPMEWRYTFIAVLMPAVVATGNIFERHAGKLDGVLIGIALELYRREHGELPTSLDELSPRWLPEVPIDRINGGPLGYRVVNGKPVVYSLGIDQDDDGGRLPPANLTSIYAYQYPVGPPVDFPKPLGDYQLEHYDGDWVIWSLE
ncbi:MAG: hypothetical protein AAGF31_08945 [Planctomycetota bacterium]